MNLPETARHWCDGNCDEPDFLRQHVSVIGVQIPPRVHHASAPVPEPTGPTTHALIAAAWRFAQTWERPAGVALSDAQVRALVLAWETSGRPS